MPNTMKYQATNVPQSEGIGWAFYSSIQCGL